jgi:hypothetical protein
VRNKRKQEEDETKMKERGERRGAAGVLVGKQQKRCNRRDLRKDVGEM